MIFYFAGAKPPTKAHPWDQPEIPAGHQLHLMLTYYEFRSKKMGKPKRKFLRYLKNRRKK